jgi:redox-sensitive bicupin YhaK (pirin superfamily)
MPPTRPRRSLEVTMTNLDVRPDEVRLPAQPCREVELVEPRAVPLGGIRAMTVRRTLPARGRPFIGSWCFLDHYGPDRVAETGGMNVPPHPHCGLATASWLFRGEIEHRDSLGTRELVLPGELNLMTAGYGIAHSEVSTPATTILHGVQLWLALPPDRRDIAGSFLHDATPVASEAGVTWRVFMGELDGEGSRVAWHAPTLGAEVLLSAGIATQVTLRSEFEHGVLVDSGDVEVNGMPVAPGVLVALPIGPERLHLRAGDERARLLLIGGTPMDADLVMWWNFVGGSHEEIVEARAAWQAEIGAEPSQAAAAAGRRFGSVLGYDGAALPAPRLPGGRLKPRHR